MSPHARYLLLFVAAVAVVTASGCDSGGSKHLSMAQMRAHLDKVPLPADVVLKRNDEQPRQSVAAGEISRQYTYTGSARPLCRTLLEGIATAGYTITDIDGPPITVATCSADPPNRSAGTAGGGVTLVEPQGSVSIDLGWIGDTTITLGIQDTGK